jgi:hypothetical protein
VAAKKALTTDAAIKAEVDSLLGTFGVVGEAEGDFGDDAPPAVKTGERSDTAPSAEADALWGGGKQKK